jgi:predicted phosphodiesterase
MKKLIALFAGAVSIALCGWYGGAHAERQRIKAKFANTQATVVVHCGPISVHDLAAREKFIPVMDDMQRLRKAYETTYETDGYVMVLGNCDWRDDKKPPLDAKMWRPFP